MKEKKWNKYRKIRIFKKDKMINTVPILKKYINTDIKERKKERKNDKYEVLTSKKKDKFEYTHI